MTDTIFKHIITITENHQRAIDILANITQMQTARIDALEKELQRLREERDGDVQVPEGT